MWPLGRVLAGRVQPRLQTAVERLAHTSQRRQGLDLGRAAAERPRQTAGGPLGGHLGQPVGRDSHEHAVTGAQQGIWPGERGQLTAPNAVSIGDDLGLRRLAEHPLEPHGGNDTAGQQVAQHLAWPDARQLVGIADEDQLTARADGGEHGPRELGIQHAGLVHDDRVDRQRVPAAVAEAGWASPQQTVDGSGLQADHLAQPLGGLAGRRPQGHRAAEGLE